MAKSRQKKEIETAALSDRFRRMKIAVLTTTSGLKVKDLTELRSNLRQSSIEYVVAKKTLVKRALKTAGLEAIDFTPIESSFSLAFGYDDEVVPAKLLAQFAKTHESVLFLGGILNGVFVEAERMKQLAKLPSRDELRARVVGTLAAPISGFANVLAGNLSGFVRILNAVREQKAVL